MTIGEKISPILEEISMALLEHAVNNPTPYEFTHDGFIAAMEIFTEAMMDKMFQLQKTEKFILGDACNMAESCGKDIRKLVHTYTGIDTHKIYSDE